MKATFDLPRDLIHKMKLQALHEGRKLKDVAADLLRTALHPDPAKKHPASTATSPPKTLPVLKTNLPGFSNSPPMTAQAFCDFIKQADADLDADHHETTARH